MGIGFHLQVVDSLEWQWLRRVCAVVPVAALLLAAWQCASGPTWFTPDPFTRGVLLSVICLSVVLWAIGPVFWPGVCFRGRPTSPHIASLRADASGIFFTPKASPESEVPASVSRVLRLPGLIVMQLTPVTASGRRLVPTSVAIGCSSLSRQDWRQLNVWLLWVERGAGSTHRDAVSHGAA